MSKINLKKFNFGIIRLLISLNEQDPDCFVVVMDILSKSTFKKKFKNSTIEACRKKMIFNYYEAKYGKFNSKTNIKRDNFIQWVIKCYRDTKMTGLRNLIEIELFRKSNKRNKK